MVRFLIFKHSHITKRRETRGGTVTGNTIMHTHFRDLEEGREGGFGGQTKEGLFRGLGIRMNNLILTMGNVVFGFGW